MDGMDRVREKRSFWKKGKFWMAVGAFLLLGFLVILLLQGSTTTVRIEKDKLSVSTVTQGIFNDYIRVIGSVEPIRFIYLDAEEGGRVEEVVNEEGNSC